MFYAVLFVTGLVMITERRCRSADSADLERSQTLCPLQAVT